MIQAQCRGKCEAAIAVCCFKTRYLVFFSNSVNNNEIFCEQNNIRPRIYKVQNDIRLVVDLMRETNKCDYVGKRIFIFCRMH